MLRICGLPGIEMDCGCVSEITPKREKALEDLTGRHFGEWEVLKRAKSKKGRTMWECRCSCGTERTISTHDLKAGKTHSCRNTVHINLYRRRELSGKQFGSLKVLKATNQRDYKGSIIWHCLCEKCGKEKDISEDALVHGGYKSCGCEQHVFGKELSKQRHFYNGTCLEALSLERKARSDNQSGMLGVNIGKNGLYKAAIGFQGKRYYLGTYKTMEEAGIAYQTAKQKLHGGFIKAYTAWNESGKAEELIFNVTYVNGEFLIQSNFL